jgi:hypothetical protein
MAITSDITINHNDMIENFMKIFEDNREKYELIKYSTKWS